MLKTNSDISEIKKPDEDEVVSLTGANLDSRVHLAAACNSCRFWMPSNTGSSYLVVDRVVIEEAGCLRTDTSSGPQKIEDDNSGVSREEMRWRLMQQIGRYSAALINTALGGVTQNPRTAAPGDGKTVCASSLLELTTGNRRG
ncbi:hypothetical protein T265_01676 [Opisthorchis viverrini]|uniref:Uncharacterized protein n=1 Tax=Opisthorchis viverrini TaxID=6198 RepID=A0A075AIU5_OPIVI|nr:hypothetical protein T265_01676 [Opisthorchis viverrini]KER32244.1 hypothetical protein T265_01676 [Opisthorchis viverrini]